MDFIRNFFVDYNFMVVPAALLSIILHEISHGYVAYLLGDPTAKVQGRLSLNPLRHIDPLGLLMLIFFKMGWAKPVSVDIRYFKKPKRDFALTALAGPVSNFLVAFLSVLILFILAACGAPYSFVTALFVDMTVISIGLGLFNLIPIPPLDGSKVVGAFLPDKLYYKVLRYERWGMVLLFAILYLGILDGVRVKALSYTVFYMVRFLGIFFGDGTASAVFFQLFS